MKIEYRIAGSVSTYQVLYDESAGQVSPTYNLSFEDMAEETPGFGAPSQGITPNGNTVVTVEIPLARAGYASPDAAKADIRNYRTTLKGLRLNLKITVGADVDYFPSAVLKSMKANLSGRSVDYTFTFRSQDVTSVEPA